MNEKPAVLNLFEFTFQSLYLVRTSLPMLGGPGLVKAVNAWYMPLIGTGWAIPLGFVVDVIRDLAFNVPDKSRIGSTKDPLLTKLLEDYQKLLRRIHADPTFARVAAIVGVDDERRRQRAVLLFLRFLLAGLKDFKMIYAFDTRQLKLTSAKATSKGIESMSLELAGKAQARKFMLLRIDDGLGRPEFGAIRELLRRLCDYYLATPLDAIIRAEELLQLDLTAHSDEGKKWIDDLLVQELLRRRPPLEPCDEAPRPRLVEKLVPTEQPEADGPAAGFTDIRNKKFSGGVVDLLPIEMALSSNEAMFYHKLLNEGALHYIRENIENIDEEYRFLFCFVIDSHPLMYHSPKSRHARFPKGYTPSQRARVLVSWLLHDLALHLPREDVRVQTGLYFATERKSARDTRKHGAELDLFRFDPKTCVERLTFLGRLNEQAPALFHVHTRLKDRHPNRSSEPTPTRYVQAKRVLRPHAIHVMYLTSRATRRTLLGTGGRDELALEAAAYTSNSLWVVECDVDQPTVGLTRPLSSTHLFSLADDKNVGRIGEDQLRGAFLETVLRKAAGKFFVNESAVELVEDIA